MSSNLTMIISMISAQMVMIGSENEQTMPKPPPDSLHGGGSPTLRSLCNGNGSRARIRSTTERLLSALTWPQSTSDMTKAVLRSYLRRPAGMVSAGMLMRIGRAVASESKKAASWKAAVGSLTTGALSAAQFGRSSTQRMVNQGESKGMPLACATAGAGTRAEPAGGAASTATS